MGPYRVDHKLASNLDFQAVEIRLPFQFPRFHHPSEPEHWYNPPESRTLPWSFNPSTYEATANG